MTPERRNAVVSTALVGTVVVVLGFGAGLGALFSGGSSTSASAAPPSGDGATAGAATGAGGSSSGPAVHDAGPASSMSMGGASGSLAAPAVPTSYYSGSSATPAAGAAYSAPSPAPSSGGPSASGPAPSGSSSGSMPSGSMPSGSMPSGSMPSGSMPSGSGSTCTNEIVVNAMLDPFISHVYRAHLERSPGQQANDLLNVNQYVLTHTVLLEDMLAPAIAAVQASLNGIVPFTNHMYRAHLERSPGQQVNDALNVNQYVTTHTVLAEDMTAPAVDSIEGSYGC